MDLPVDPCVLGELARAECRTLLDLESLGRLAVRVDWFHRSGWSVMVQGRAELVETDSRDIDDPDVWAPGPQQILVRVTPSQISGRRLELHQQSLDAAGCL